MLAYSTSLVALAYSQDVDGTVSDELKGIGGHWAIAVIRN